MSSWIVETLVATTMLMAVVMILRQPVAAKFGGKYAYLLWALPALRMVLPPLPEGWGWQALYVPVATVASADEGHSAQVTLALMDPVEAQAHAVEIAARAPIADTSSAWATIAAQDWPTILLTVWLAGAALWFAWQMLNYAAFIRRAMEGAKLLSRECGIDVLVTPGVEGPMAAGFIRRRIFLPADFLSRYSSEERRLAVLHEAAHHDRWDIFANLGALAVLSMHWFNPIAHRAYRAFRVDQELACDATVLKGATPDSRYIYGSAVVKAACKRAPAAACALNHKDQLKRRLKMMGKGETRGGLAMAGKLGVAALVGLGLGVTASVGIATENAEATTAKFRMTEMSPVDRTAASMIAPRVTGDGGRVSPARHRVEKTWVESVPPVEPVGPIASIAPVAPSAPLPPTGVPHAPFPPVAPVAPDVPSRAEIDAAVDSALHVASASARSAERHAMLAARQAEIAGRQADRDAAAADRAAAVADRHAERASHSAQAMIERQRASMARACAEKGKPVAATSDWSTLALCGSSKEMAAASLRHARDNLDREIARLEAGN
ncbi:M56 family metallopeptidase [Sphingomonas sp. ID0503]|uniref:M56 family metallopeptidase n=1 Tax=Sphingomonas sp. ID0503 TaxID=3399691 RepID=UPI003AFB0430